MLMIPKLVEKHLVRCAFDPKVRLIVVTGGIVWILFSCNHELIYPVLGISDCDAYAYKKLAFEHIIPELESGNYALILRCLVKPGESFYITYQAVIYHLGGTPFSVLAINAFMAFWGGLALTRFIYSFSSISSQKGMVLPLLLIFTPSVVFWSSANLKEAFSYWAICQVFCFLRPVTDKKEVVYNFAMLLIGTAVGLVVRPHIILFWIFGVFLVIIIQKQYWKYAIVLVLLAPLMIWQVKIVTGVNLLNFKETKQLLVRGEKFRQHLLSDIAVDPSTGASTFRYGGNGPVPILSGAKNTLFRPFFWRANNMRSLLTAIEIWTITVGIILSWMRIRSKEWKIIFRNPAIRCAILVCIPFFLFFTYFPNEGLIARQRIQLFPALMVLLAIPLLLRRSRRTSKKNENSYMPPTQGVPQTSSDK